MILGCSTDTPAENKAFRDKFSYPFDLLSDEDAGLAKSYGVPLRDTGRYTRVSVLIGADGKVAKRYDPVTPAEHAAEVLADL